MACSRLPRASTTCPGPHRRSDLSAKRRVESAIVHRPSVPTIPLAASPTLEWGPMATAGTISKSALATDWQSAGATAGQHWPDAEAASDRTRIRIFVHRRSTLVGIGLRRARRRRRARLPHSRQQLADQLGVGTLTLSGVAIPWRPGHDRTRHGCGEQQSALGSPNWGTTVLAGRRLNCKAGITLGSTPFGRMVPVLMASARSTMSPANTLSGSIRGSDRESRACHPRAQVPVPSSSRRNINLNFSGLTTAGAAATRTSKLSATSAGRARNAGPQLCPGNPSR